MKWTVKNKRCESEKWTWIKCMDLSRYKQSWSDKSFVCSNVCNGGIHVLSSRKIVDSISYQPLFCFLDCNRGHFELRTFWRLNCLLHGVGGIHSYTRNFCPHFYGGRHVQGNRHRCFLCQSSYPVSLLEFEDLAYFDFLRSVYVHVWSLIENLINYACRVYVLKEVLYKVVNLASEEFWQQRFSMRQAISVKSSWQDLRPFTKPAWKFFCFRTHNRQMSENLN